MAGTLGSTLTATRWVVPVPDVDAETTVTVFNPGPEPVTAELLAADLVDRRVGADQRARAGDPARCGQERAPRAGSASRPVPTVVTANHPVVVGLTVLGDAGAALSTAIPDLAPREADGWSSAW